MPVYEYRCAACGAEFAFLLIRSTDEPVCPECKSQQVTKKISSFSCSAGGAFSGGIASSGGGGC